MKPGNSTVPNVTPNVLKEPEAGKPALKKQERRKRKPLALFRYLNVFGLVEKEMLLRIMPFVMFLTFIGLLYIANSYYSERTLREIDRVTKEIKELKPEYISTKSELMIKSNQSQVAKAVEPIGLKESNVPPIKIVIHNDPQSVK